MPTTDQRLLLKTELAAVHPVTGAYSLDATEALNELRAFNIPGTVSHAALLEYVLFERHRTANAADTPMPLYGRIKLVAQAAVGDMLFDATPVTLDWKASCLTMLRILDSNGSIAVPSMDPRFRGMLADLLIAGCIGAGDKKAIEALADSRSNRLMQLGLPRTNVGDILTARAS